MALSNEMLEEIGAYLSGQLPADEKARFETRLQQDTDLQQEVSTQRELKQGLMFLAQKDRFRQMHTDLAARGLLQDSDGIPTVKPARSDSVLPVSNVVPISERRHLFDYGLARWAMAASVILVLGIGWVVYRNHTDRRQGLTQNERVFDAFFTATLKPSPTVAADPDRLAASPGEDQMQLDSVRLQTALLILQQADFQPAIGLLNALSVGRPGHWSASAQWYLALAYLRNNQPAEARPVLQKISQLNGHPYQAEASQLLRQRPILIN